MFVEIKDLNLQIEREHCVPRGMRTVVSLEQFLIKVTNFQR